jgi:hypothetical protein
VKKYKFWTEGCRIPNPGLPDGIFLKPKIHQFFVHFERPSCGAEDRRFKARQVLMHFGYKYHRNYVLNYSKLTTHMTQIRDKKFSKLNFTLITVFMGSEPVFFCFRSFSHSITLPLSHSGSPSKHIYRADPGSH